MEWIVFFGIVVVIVALLVVFGPWIGSDGQ